MPTRNVHPTGTLNLGAVDCQQQPPATWVPAFAGTTNNFRPHQKHDLQNKKYRCAIGSTFAGSQVSNSPFARTS